MTDHELGMLAFDLMAENATKGLREAKINVGAGIHKALGVKVGEAKRLFPVTSSKGSEPHPTKIPWEVSDLAYSVYKSRYGNDQSLEKLANRGGFSAREMDSLLPDWRIRCGLIPMTDPDTGFIDNSNGNVDVVVAGKVVKSINIEALADTIMRRVMKFNDAMPVTELVSETPEEAWKGEQDAIADVIREALGQKEGKDND